MQSVTKIYENVLDPITESLGLTTNFRRFAVFGGGAALTLWVLKPDALFLVDGSPRQWKAIDPNDRTATPVPWYLVSFIVGASSALFL